MNFHSHQNLLTFDNLHQEYQIFQLEIHVCSLGNEADVGHFRPTFTTKLHKNAYYTHGHLERTAYKFVCLLSANHSCVLWPVDQ